MSSPIMRAGQRGLSTHKITSPTSKSRITDIGKRNFSRNDEDDDDSDDGDTGEAYSIDPAVQLWKSIDFTKNLKSASNHETASEQHRDEDRSAPSFSSTKLKSASLKSFDCLSSGSEIIVDPDASATVLYASTSLDTLIKQSQTQSFRSSALDRVDELKRALAALESDKIKSNKDASEGLVKLEASGVRGESFELQQQRIELKHMKELMALERKELEMRALLAEAEKLWQKDEDDRKLDKEREEMKVQMEIMRMQNQMLMNRMEKSQAEARDQLTRERAERLIELSKMQQENHQLTEQILDTQAKAEQDLAQEREAMRRAVKRMEQERMQLLQRVKATEDQAKNESILLELQKITFQENLDRLEREKQLLSAQVVENELASKEASEAASARLHSEREALELRMKEMEMEKANLAATLSETEKRAMEHATELAAQLAKEKEELNATLQRMEEEKKTLVTHLSWSEKEAQDNAKLLDLRLEQEKIDVAAAMAKMDAESKELHTQLVLESGASKEIKIELEIRLEQVLREKEQLAESFRLAESAAVLREKMVTERMAKERDELKLAVQKMKEDFIAEQLKNISYKDNGATGNESSNAAAVATGSLKTLKPSKSLFDLLEESESSRAVDGTGLNRKPSLLSKKSMVPRTINMIPEGKETELEADDAEINELADSFMDESSNEGDGDNDSDANSNNNAFADLPAPHSAAASGNLEKVKMLANLDPSLLLSFDGAHRNPLFYAAAYGRGDIVEFILSLSPADGNYEPDVHGDTALHAATSAGNPECLEMLIRAAESKSSGEELIGIVSKKNTMDMTPAHLASSVECLEVLYKHGAELTAVDSNGRSPLFVACAMNREDCAEYLINALDQDETSLMIQDARGDTPLHAAACNGSVECLLLLLQYGIDPTLANARGLKAIELAVKNKHRKCKELLAEYHLHFSTSCDFDSVLFLAALEGHKQIKKHAKKGGGGARDEDDASYQIIRKKGSSGDPASAAAANPADLKKIQSFFSLKANKSLRLQRWGPWIAYEDQTTHNIYWYNHETASGQWNKPDQVVKMQLSAGKDGTSYSDLLSGSMNRKGSMRMKKLGDWIQYVTEGGQTFYYNDKNADFQWDPPRSMLSLQPGTGASTGPFGGTKQPPGKGKGAQATTTTTTAAASAAGAGADDTGGDIVTGNEEEDKDRHVGFGDWRPYKDPSTGEIFWYNEVTKVSQWHMPEEVEAFAKKSGNSNNFDADNEDSDAIQINHEDDLGI